MKRKFLSLLLVTLMVFSLATPALANTRAPEWMLTIIHTNDIHSRYVEDSANGYTGIAKIAGEKARLAAAGENVLWVDAGDSTHGELITSLYKGTTAVKILNLGDLDYFVPGNHEFNYGWEQLKKNTLGMTATVLGGNVRVDETNTRLFQSMDIKEIDGKKIGFFGLCTPDTKYKAHPNNTLGLTFLNPASVAKWAVKELKRQGAEYIVAIGHLGVDDSSTMTSEQVIKKVKGIDLFIDGHSHTVFEEGKKINNTMLVSAGEYGKYVGKVDIVFDEGEFTTVASLDSYEQTKKYPVKANVLNALNEVVAKVDAETSKAIFKLDKPLDGARATVRGGECELGNLVADALRWVSGADVAFTNGGGIRATIPAGSVTMKSILTTLPFDNTVETRNVKGSTIIKVLEFGMSNYPELSGGYPQVSGVTFTFDVSSKKVSNVKVNGVALNPSKTYVLATNDFIAAGGDGYTMLGGAVTGYYPKLSEVLISYVQSSDFTGVPAVDRVNFVD